jgi:hypothetical protein
MNSMDAFHKIIVSLNALLKNIESQGRSARFENWSYPAHDFEELSGLEGLAHDYNIPTGLDLDLEQVAFVAKEFYSRDAKNSVYVIAAVLLESNPELKTVKFTTPDEAYMFLTGVGSGFNPDDIDFFINEIEKWPDEEAQRYMDSVKQELNAMDFPKSTGWAISPKTLELIREQFSLKAGLDYDPLS